MRSSNAMPALLSGVIGAFAMAALIYIVPRFGLPQLDIITILGVPFTSDVN